MFFTLIQCLLISFSLLEKKCEEENDGSLLLYILNNYFNQMKTYKTCGICHQIIYKNKWIFFSNLLMSNGSKTPR